jgi:hypothetical protein
MWNEKKNDMCMVGSENHWSKSKLKMILNYVQNILLYCQ